jgi:hypothetical protein
MLLWDEKEIERVLYQISRRMRVQLRFNQGPQYMRERMLELLIEAYALGKMQGLESTEAFAGCAKMVSDHVDVAIGDKPRPPIKVQCRVVELNEHGDEYPF